MDSIRKQRTRAAASTVATHADEAMPSTLPAKAKTSLNLSYKKTRSQNIDLVEEKEPTSSLEAKDPAEKGQVKLKKSTTASLTAATTTTTTAADTAKLDLKTHTAAATDSEHGVDTEDTLMEDAEKANTPSPDGNINHSEEEKEKVEINQKSDPTAFRSATTTLQKTMAMMNAKAITQSHISCDDLDVVYKQFELFINNHPTLAPVLQPMAAAAKISAMPPPLAPVAAQVDNGGGKADGNIGGIAAKLSTMLSDLENSVLAAAAVATGSEGGGGGGGSGAAPIAAASEPQQPIPQLRAGWDASSLLQLQPALAAALSDRLKNNTTSHRSPLGDGATTMTTTTTLGGGGGETTVLQDKIRKAIVAAQAGYSINNNTTTVTGGGGQAAAYTPAMSSQQQQQQPSQYYNHSSQIQQQQSSLIYGSQEHYYQPSAADSAAIAAATAAALAGQSRAGMDKTPALELLRALSNINYTSDGPMMGNTTTNNAMVSNRSHPSRSYSDRAAYIYSGGDGDDGGGGGEELYEELIDRSRSPTPTINPHTNRPLRRVVVQKAADELAASALVSLGTTAGPIAPPSSRGNKFNRNGIKRPAIAPAAPFYEEYPSYSDGGGINRKRKSPSKGAGGSGSGGSALPPPLPSTAPETVAGGPSSDPEVTAKVQLLMLMAQNLGEMQNPTNNNNNATNIGGGSAAVTRAGSEGPVEGKAAASV